MFRKVYTITWTAKSGKPHSLTYNTKEEALAWADRLDRREKRDGIKRDRMITECWVVE